MWKLICALVLSLSLGSACCCANYQDAISRAQELVKSGDRQAAANVLEQALGQDRDDEAEWLRGAILIWRGAPDRHIMAQFLTVADRFPASRNAALALVRVGRLRDKIGEDSRPDWERVVREYPETGAAAQALHCLGHLALRDGNAMLAGAKFDESAALSAAAPGVIEDSVMEAGYAYISHYWQTRDFGVLHKAIARFKRLKSEAKSTERSLRARMGLGEVYLIQGFYDKALAEYQDVLDTNPSDVFIRSIAQFEIGCCLYGKKDYTAAIAAFDTFLSACSGSTSREKDSAWKAARPGYADLLVRDAEKASKLCGLDLIPEALCCKARCLLGLGHYAEADQIAEQTLNEFPKVASSKRAKEVRDLCKAMRGR